MPKRGHKFVASAVLAATCALILAVPVTAVEAQTASTTPVDGQSSATTQVVNAFGQTSTTRVGPVSASSGVTITGPHQSDTIVNTQVQISGTAPAQALVSIAMVDAGTGRTNVQHQPGGRIDGSVTSDASGRWVFVPAVKVVPGSFAVSASYTDGQNPTVTSATVKFTVVNDSGQSAVRSASWTGKIVLSLLVVGFGTAFLLMWRRRGTMHPYEWLLARLLREGLQLPASRPPHKPRHHRPLKPDRPDRQVSPDEPAEPAGLPPADDQPAIPLFMSTVAGRSFRAEQARKIRVIDLEMKATERALIATAEALEHSSRTMAVLRREIDDELSETEPDGAAKVNGPDLPLP